MRIIIILLLILAIGEDTFSQAGHKKVASSNRAMPAKSEIQSQMNQVVGELKKTNR